ncbi:PD-(D/E)XK nuclease family protein [Alicyclobacillus sp. SO9]|uniref:PD-(D/E)XK nuclease family protein n=1 Tax=Alicyclobacillus sp. SO9 TaxID=2665646 RepID=UPI0018E88889|nr:PD-(D/E)XK nuclease family protein [Alicyclobacillus sp. SO9]QQE80463.1 PD-(D/E)XK nuclease family protein [Alicyclobacillus sp. SO9]
MHIILGYELDSNTFPDALGEHEAAVGTVVTGFRGLVGMLETQLGLISPQVSEIQRIAEWEERARRCADERFPFVKSFAVDSWNTAKELLRRRDELVIAGWDPDTHVGGSPLIDALARLEKIVETKSPGFSDRVSTLLTTLQQPARLDMDTITVVDENPALWDPWCHHLMEAVERHGVTVQSDLGSLSRTDYVSSDLARFQGVVSGKFRPEDPDKFEAKITGDGSLRLIHAEQEFDAGDYLVTWLQLHGDEDTVIIDGGGSLFLDELLHRRGLPAAGVKQPSKWRSILQVLPLTIDTYWEPLLAGRLLELLTLPQSPVPSQLRYRLAKILASAPGIGGPGWEKAIHEGVQTYEKKWVEDQLDEKEIRKKRDRLQDIIDVWVNHPYFDANEGMPVQHLVRICQKVGQWAASRAMSSNDSLYMTAQQQTAQVADAVKSLGVDRLTRLEVGRILDSVLGEGITLPEMEQQASPWKLVQHPGQIWAPVSKIVWWGFHRSGGTSTRTWTRAERKWLQQQGVWLPEEGAHRQREALAWQRAAQMAKTQFIMIAPDKVRGAAAPVHPLWDEIRQAIAPPRSGDEQKITCDASNLRYEHVVRIAGEEVTRRALAPLQLPRPLRNWEAPAGRIGPREMESATSVEKLLGCPLNWTLSYAAGVREGGMLSLPNESIMLGTLAHEVLCHLLNESSHWRKEDAERRAGDLFDDLVPQYARPLLEPQNGVLLTETRILLQKALGRFCQFLNETGIQIDETEYPIEKQWSDSIKMGGRLDLVGKTESGSRLLFDAKWSRRPNKYREKLEKLSPQLALYHWLLTEDEAEEIPVAYFMLRSGDLFAHPHTDIPVEHHVNGPSLVESVAQLRNGMEQEWQRLSGGTVVASAITMDDSETDAAGHQAADASTIVAVAPVPPDESDGLLEPPCRFCEYQNLCGLGGVTA